MNLDKHLKSYQNAGVRHCTRLMNTGVQMHTAKSLPAHGCALVWTSRVHFFSARILIYHSRISPIQMMEILLTIMSSLSQEESRSISENVKWGQRKRFADGKCSVSFSRFLGYDQDADGNWVINEEEAETVREIFRLFLEGLSGKAIADRLTEEGKPTPGGQKDWNPGTINRMLRNLMLAIWIQ